MASEQLPPVRIDEGLLDEVRDFGEEHGFDSMSAAVRELLRRGLREKDLSKMLLFSIDRDMEDVVDELPDETNSLVKSWLDLFNQAYRGIDLIKLAGGEDDVSKEELAAAYRFQRSEATSEDFIKLTELMGRVRTLNPDEFQDQLRDL